MKNKKWILPIASTVITLLLSLGILHLFAPSLLGEAVEMEVVQLDEKKVSFFDNVFKKEDFRRGGGVDHIRVPNLYRRMTPLASDLEKLGPTDLLGFRNRNIPSVPDIIAIGDSQTHGINANHEENWPGRLRAKLSYRNATIYNMSIGGWGAVEYYEIFRKAVYFRPYVVIVAFYTGNDPLDSYARAYEYKGDRWKHLRSLSVKGRIKKPKAKYPPSKRDQWVVSFADRSSTIFTAEARLASNKDHPAVSAGYDVMAAVADEIGKAASKLNIRVIFTVLPTKELAYRKRLEAESIPFHQTYEALVVAETQNIVRLSARLKKVKGAVYVDSVAALQSAVLESNDVYPHSMDGHPMPEGYDVIAETLRAETEKRLPAVADGLYQIGKRSPPWVLVENGHKRLINSTEELERLGLDPKTAKLIRPRDLERFPYMSLLSL
jgi:lysophospholipase L1-like esterase